MPISSAPERRRDAVVPPTSTDRSRPGAGIRWARVEEGFHVASRDGAFLGYLDREADGSYLVYDGRSRRAGRGSTLVDAMRILVSVAPSPQPPRVVSSPRSGA